MLEFPVDQTRPTSDRQAGPLLEFLIETYTLPGEIALDSAMGIGSTGIAAANTSRRLIGIEKDTKFFRIAREVLGNSQRIPPDA